MALQFADVNTVSGLQRRRSVRSCGSYDGNGHGWACGLSVMASIRQGMPSPPVRRMRRGAGDSSRIGQGHPRKTHAEDQGVAGAAEPRLRVRAELASVAG